MEVEREICRALVQFHSEGEGAKEVCYHLPKVVVYESLEI